MSPRPGPAGAGAGGHAAPWGSPEVGLIISGLSSHSQHPARGTGREGSESAESGRNRRPPAKAWARGRQGCIWGQWGQGRGGRGEDPHGESGPASLSSGRTRHFARDLGSAVSPGWEGETSRPRSCLRFIGKGFGFCRRRHCWGFVLFRLGFGLAGLLFKGDERV